MSYRASLLKLLITASMGALPRLLRLPLSYHSHIHVGVAVAVDEGLVVPVVKHTNQLSLTQIGAAVRDLAGKARHKKISVAEMQGSTFTVSNLGMFGIENFTSIINQPNSAILSVGAIVEKPVVKNGQIVVGNTMKLTLTCDHRTVDGGHSCRSQRATD